MDEPVKILCVDDEPNVIKALQRMFMDEDYEIFSAASGEEGLALLAEHWDIQVVISDFRMPGMNGVEFLKAVHDGWPDTIRIVLSGYADVAAVVAAINEGKIYKFIGKPWQDEELKSSISKAIEHYALERQNKKLARELEATNAELQMHNKALEKLVVDRTAELVFENQMLRQGQTILDHLPWGVVAIDRSGFVSLGNQRFVEMIGGTSGSVVGEDISQIFPEEVTKFIAGIDNDQFYEGDYAIQGKSYRIRGGLVERNEEPDLIILVLELATAGKTGTTGI